MTNDKANQRESGVSENDDSLHLYAQPLSEPILGKHYQLPGRSGIEHRIDLDVTASYIPVFTHLKIHEAGEVNRPPTPPALRRVAKESSVDFQDYVDSDQGKGDSFREDTSIKHSRRTTTK
ncbi:WD repeat-containing protein on Y chromosome [Stomoxys calcitrans]|uniref:WD repeat-containing protein on Y chromosome n=1 Tax=Stomoxys calcitrans TaxID=35570 RepID=UPI0027E32099|nr:WD repeat-containing protein on Y chromosome [Stomoxys calcitrans]